MKIRLIDIARVANVSEATVSRVLANRPGVNPATKARVIAAAKELGQYVGPEQIVKTDSQVIGVLVPNMDNPVFPLFLDRIESEASSKGYSLVVAFNAFSPPQEAAAMQRLVDAGARGIIVVSGWHANEDQPVEYYQSFSDRQIKLCLINGEREEIAASFIITDDAKAIELALAHARDIGHEVVGLAVGDEHSYPVIRKVAAFEANWPPEKAPIAYTDFSYAGGYQAALELIDQGCTLMICGSDQMAIGAISAIRALGLSVPEDFSIIGFDDIPELVSHTPPITTIRQKIQLIARTAVKAVIASPDASRQAARSSFVVSPELVVRGSTAPPKLKASRNQQVN